MTRVFVADADSTVRSSLVLLLKRKLDIREIVEIADAGQLNEKLTCCRPNVLLLDWDLPGLNMVELRDRLLKEGRRPVLVVMSVQSQNAPLAMAGGADAFLAKSEPGEYVLDLLRGLLPRG